MPVASGLVAQFGVSEETTPGTRVAASKFFEFTQESLKYHRNRIESKGLRAGRVVGPTRWAAGIGWVDGDVTFECAPQGFGTLLKHMIGPDVTTGAGPYVHTFASGGILDNLTYTVQVGRPDTSGTIRPFEYTGCSITDWALDAEVDAYLMMTCSFYGMTESTGQTLATASYPATITPFTYLMGSITVAGSAFDVKKFSIAGDNALVTGRHQIRATTPEQPKVALQGDRRQYTGTLTADFTDLTAYTRFTAGTEAAVVLTFNAGAGLTLVITGNVRFDGDTPSVGGPDLLEQALPFKFLSSTSDAAAFTAVLTNSDATV